MIKEQNTTINKIMDGSTQINRAYLNNSVVFGSMPMPLEVFETGFTFTSKASTSVLKVRGENWTASKTGEWFSISPVSGDGTGYITITVSKNEVIGVHRTGSIVVSSNGVSSTVSMYQAGASARSLPEVDCLFNINAKEFDGPGNYFPEGEYNTYDLLEFTNNYDGMVFTTLNGGDPTISSDHITVPSGSYINFLFDSINDNPFNIVGADDKMTIVFKTKSTGEHLIGNRSDSSFDGANNGGTYNYMVRYKTSYYTIHIDGEGYANTPTTAGEPEIISFVFDGSGYVRGYNWTTQTAGNTNSYGSRPGSTRFGIFNGNYSSEFWSGDFYWMYIAPEALTYEQIEEVINFNEN